MLEYFAAEDDTSILSEKAEYWVTTVEALRRSLTGTTPPPPPPPSLLDRFYAAWNSSPAVSYTTLSAILLAVLYLLFHMSWARPSHESWGGRSSPYAAASGHAQVTDRDFEYVSPEVDPFDAPHRQRNSEYQEDDTEAPDIIRLQHKNHTFETRYPPFAISDGDVYVGQVREKAANELLGSRSDPRRVRLIYKGKELKDDSKPAKTEGLKQLSQILCVVSDAFMHGSSSGSASEGESNVSAATNGSVTKKKRRKSKKKTSKEGLNPPPADKGPSPSSTPRAMSPQNAMGANSPQGQVEKLASTFHTVWVPKCVRYLSSPPEDTKSIEQEFLRLSVSLEEQIVLKADEIEMQGDGNARQKRKDLVTEVQAMLKKLDEAKARYMR
ncbi:MAG: hypothetical protein Q9227_003735 [Pyrenula ochraceoflavens]